MKRFLTVILCVAAAGPGHALDLKEALRRALAGEEQAAEPANPQPKPEVKPAPPAEPKPKPEAQPPAPAKPEAEPAAEPEPPAAAEAKPGVKRERPAGAQDKGADAEDDAARAARRARQKAAKTPLAMGVRGYLVTATEDGGEELVGVDHLNPGQVVAYEVMCRNRTEWPIENIEVVVPVPVPTVYVGNSASGPDGTDFRVSLDDGKSFAAEPVHFQKTLEDGTQTDAIASPTKYTHLRWQMARLEPEERLTFRYRSRVLDKLPAGLPGTAAVPRPTARSTAPNRPRRTDDAGTEEPFPLLAPTGWQAPVGWDDTLPTEVSADLAEGVTIRFTGQQTTGWNKAVAYKPFRFPLERDRVLAVDVQNHLDTSCRMALAVATPSFMESEPITIKPGVNRNIIIDLAYVRWKSARTNWNYRAPLPKRSQLGFFCFVIYPSKGSGQVDIVRARLIKPPE